MLLMNMNDMKQKSIHKEAVALVFEVKAYMA